MNRCGSFLLIFCALAFGQEDAPKPVTVHFIGNSYTHQNDLPGMVAAMGRAVGHPLEVSRTTRGGAWLEQHWSNQKLLRTLRDTPPRWIVLQEQSQMALVRAGRLRDGRAVEDGRVFMHEHVRRFAALARTNDIQVALYQTWARERIPDQTEPLAEAYETIAAEVGARVAPAGRAFAKAVAEGHDLYKGDGSHPTRAGTYLAACCMVATITGVDPATIPDEAVKDVPRAADLRRIAATFTPAADTP